jgi:hypothetical protein
MLVVLPRRRRRRAASPRRRRRRRRRGRLRWRQRASWCPSGRLQRRPRGHAQGTRSVRWDSIPLEANQENLKTGSGLLSQDQAKGLQPEILCPPNFSKNPILDLLAEHKYNCQAKKVLATWGGKLDKTEMNMRRTRWYFISQEQSLKC